MVLNGFPCMGSHAWGNPITSSGSTVNPFRWVGRYGYYFDTVTGLFYIRARTYQPTVARWTSVDPLTRRNRYHLTYAYANPSRLTDPSGMNPIVILIGGGIAITELEAIAAGFGLGLWACLSHPTCNAAIKAQIAEFIGAMEDAALEALFGLCKGAYASYEAADKAAAACRCTPVAARTAIGKWIACSHAVTCLAYLETLAMARAAYMLSGCDFVLEENHWDGHTDALDQVQNRLKKCHDARDLNCSDVCDWIIPW